MPARLIPVNGGAAFRLEKPITLIGRHEDCDLALPEQVKISRRHCCVARVDDRFVVRDLGSMNGVRVNGKRVTEEELRPGDELAVADTVFVFQDMATFSTQKSGVPLRGSDQVEPRVSNLSGDVVLVPSGPESEDRVKVDASANVGRMPPLQARCDFESEREVQALSEDLLPTPRMMEPSGRDEFGPAPLTSPPMTSPPMTSPPTSDSQSGLRFIGA
ncbi:MAG: FHA domain-containing protein [Planctomycetaceae bacterium]|jgi:pSer/pThr/pTyr-binding forkhead associated (FHA) protein